MTGRKADALTTPEDAREVLGLDEAEMNAAILAGDLRRVTHGGETFVLGVDVDKALRDQDPRYLAKVVTGKVTEDDEEGNNPRTLAANMPRL